MTIQFFSQSLILYFDPKLIPANKQTKISIIKFFFFITDLALLSGYVLTKTKYNYKFLFIQLVGFCLFCLIVKLELKKVENSMHFQCSIIIDSDGINQTRDEIDSYF